MSRQPSAFSLPETWTGLTLKPHAKRLSMVSCLGDTTTEALLSQCDYVGVQGADPLLEVHFY